MLAQLSFVLSQITRYSYSHTIIEYPRGEADCLMPAASNSQQNISQGFSPKR